MDSVAAIPKYNLNEDQEKKLILREYRALLRVLKPKLKPGDKELIRRAFEMAADAHKHVTNAFISSDATPMRTICSVSTL